MITSKINEILIKNQIATQENNQNTENKFLDVLIDNKNNNSSKIELTYQNIRNIPFSQIDTLFENNDEKTMARNLKLATMFSQDENLSKALFNTVLGKPFDLGYTYLYNMYEDKSNYLNPTTNNLVTLLEQTINKNFETEEMKVTDKISQSKLNEILTAVNSYNFVTALTNGYKDLNDKYKDSDNKYSFLYNDFYLQYQELEYKYNKIKDENDSILNQLR